MFDVLLCTLMYNITKIVQLKKLLREQSVGMNIYVVYIPDL